jgi:hypothetical protein
MSDTFPYPTGSVVGVLADESACDAARARLEQAGFAGRVDVLHGAEGVARLDVSGDAHGSSGSLLRRLQTAFSDDAEHVRRYADDLRQGRYVVGVAVGEDETARQRAADALRVSGAAFLNYYAENYVEDLTS